MRTIKFILCGLLLWSLAVGLRAQCPDFTDLNSPNVTGYYGHTYNPMSDTGIVSGRHTLITQQGTDLRTGGLLPLLPDGENAVIKLGNELVGAESESLVYTFTVDPDQSILLVKYAVVLENPNHNSADQPRFTIRMLDANDELLSPCMEYDVISSGDIPGFQSYGAHTKWRPWTINGFDLSEYAGQTVKMQVTTYDCSRGAHFGYAYFTATCISNHLAISGCNGNQVEVSAPSGFENYLWSNGSSSPSTAYTIQNNLIATCSISTVTNCQMILSATFLSQNVPTQDQVFFDTICQGDSYQNHGFVLPPQENSGTVVMSNTFFDVNNCNESATALLFLYVIPRYTHIYDAACEGQNYNAYGFTYQNLAVGSYTDTLDFSASSGCDSSLILHLSVHPIDPQPLVIDGPTELCGRSSASYHLQNPLNVSSFQWSVPEGVFVLYGNGTPGVNVYFSHESPNSSEIMLSVVNGCGMQNVTLPVTVFPAYQYIYTDTICVGNDYNQHGFQFGAQDSVGLFIHAQTDTTMLGCDSIVILQLFVADTPNVTVVPDPATLCVGEETELHAVSSQANVTLSSQLPKVWVGDILCTDNSFVHPQNWPCGKVAMGIVFYVDSTFEHGWAVSLHDDTSSCKWEVSWWPVDIPALPDCPYFRNALFDFDGYQNTLLIRNYSTADNYPAAYSVDFDNGWYLPAAGQAYHLYTSIPTVNSSLQLVGGTLFSTITQWSYWTSSEINSNAAWVLTSSRGFDYKTKNNSHSVRSVRSF